MRPTIDEQLAGAQRLLRLVAEDAGLSAGSAQLLRNADRLLTRVGTSWAAAAPYLAEDNARTSALLGRPARDPAGDAAGDLAAVATRNEELRAELAAVIRELPDTPDGHARRAEIGAHLRRRLADDPT